MRKIFSLTSTVFILFVLFVCLSTSLTIKAQAIACTQLKVTTLPYDYGNFGRFAVTRQSIQHPNGNVPAPVSVFLPSNATAENRLPVVFFAHGFGGFQYQVYEGLLQQLASNGYIVVFAPYTPNILTTNADRYEQMWTGFQLAVQQYGSVMDTTKIGFAGHSYGGGALPELTRRALAAGWGANKLFLFAMAPWYAWGSNDYSSIPSTAKLVVQIYWDDGTNDHLIAQNDLWNRLPQITERKWQIIRTARTFCALNAGHGTPVTGNFTDADGGGITNAQDYWGVWRRIHALADYTFNNNVAAKDIAFGTDGRMGRWRTGARHVTPLEATNSPVVNTQQTARFRWSDRCIYADFGTPCR
jgi:dienelactone hydrolase